MFLLMVVVGVILSQNAEGAYNYLRPGVRLELSDNKRELGVQGIARGILNEPKHLGENNIAFSLPFRDYNFLQQHGIGGNANYFRNSYRDFTDFTPVSNANINIGNSIPSSDLKRFLVKKPNIVYGSPKLSQNHHQVPLVRYPQNSGSQEINVNNVPQGSFAEVQNSLLSKVNFGPQFGVHKNPPIFYNSQSTSNVLETQHIQPQPFLKLQNDFSSQKLYNQKENVNHQSSINPVLKSPAQAIEAQASVSPVVTKHIYFHVPPPDMEESSVKPTIPKKSYKILFIKVPSQESRNIEELQAAYNKLGHIEDKTLIYVLSNNSEESSQLVVPYKPSNHEVLFVKYNGNKNDGGNTIHDAIYQKR